MYQTKVRDQSIFIIEFTLLRLCIVRWTQIPINLNESKTRTMIKDKGLKVTGLIHCKGEKTSLMDQLNIL